MARYLAVTEAKVNAPGGNRSARRPYPSDIGCARGPHLITDRSSSHEHGSAT
jgi:hypothetical protein